MLNKEQVKSMYDILTRKSIKDFVCEGQEYYNTEKGKEHETYVFIDGGPNAKVLAVGHCDYVLFKKPKINQARTRIECPQLDDRLGVWLILKFLNKVLPADMPYDILLTDFEERGNSTAKMFNPPEGKEYNWMFEFDRRGDDTVMYRYETPELRKLLVDNDFKVGSGSYTDICQLAHLGCAGFNFGTGYHGEHTDKCYANLFETSAQVFRFKEFFKKYYHTKLVGNQKEATELFNRKNNPPVYSGNINYYRGHNHYQDKPVTPDSVLYIVQYQGQFATPIITDRKPWNQDYIIGVCTMLGEVLEFPIDNRTNKPLKKAELSYAIDDKFLGAKVNSTNKSYAKWDACLTKLSKKKLSRPPAKLDKSVLNLAAEFQKLFLTPKDKVTDTIEDDRLWINDEMIKDWDEEGERRLIRDSEAIWNDDTDIEFVDDPEPSDSELEAIGNADIIADDFPGGEEARKEVVKKLNPDI